MSVTLRREDRRLGTLRPCESEPGIWRGVETLASFELATPRVWGGDWNHALSGREWAGSVAGWRSVLESAERLGLQVPTALSPHQINELSSIGHIAVPTSWVASNTRRLRALIGEGRISDHDAYWVEAGEPTTPIFQSASLSHRLWHECWNTGV